MDIDFRQVLNDRGLGERSFTVFTNGGRNYVVDAAMASNIVELIGKGSKTVWLTNSGDPELIVITLANIIAIEVNPT